MSIARTRPRRSSASRGVIPASCASAVERFGRRRHASVHAHRAGEHGSDDVDVVAHADEERAVERLPLDQFDFAARQDPAVREEAQHGRILVRDTSETGDRAGFERVEAAASIRGDPEVASGNRIAVRVDGRIAELPGDQLLELLRKCVFEHLGLRMHLVPGHAEVLHEERLEQPVMTDHLECDATTLVGESCAAIALVLDEAEARQLPQHPRNRAWADREERREVVRRRGAVLRLECVDGLRVVLDSDGQGRSLRHA